MALLRLNTTTEPHGHSGAIEELSLIVPDILSEALRSASRCKSPDNLSWVYLIEFDQVHFAPEAFDAIGIRRPASVASSVRKRQAEFLFGRLAARLALLDLSLQAVDIPIGPSREPLWPNGIIGSISHNSRYAAATALRRDLQQGVGIDIERVIDAKTHEALLAIAVDADEQAILKSHACSQWSADTLLTAAFSAKESLFKGAFKAVGHYFDFSAVRVVGWDRERAMLRLVMVETLCDQLPQARVCEISVFRLNCETILTHFRW